MHFKMTAALIVAAFAATAAFAQGGPRGQNPMGMGPANTPGWSLMTPQEREEHRARMMGFTNYEDCAAYAAEHHKQMQERASAKGMTLPPEPRMGYCQRLPHKGGSN